MTKPQERNNNNSFTAKLTSWTTGKLAKIGIGLAIGYTIYKSQIIPKLVAKVKSLFGKSPDQTNSDSNPKSL